MGWDGTERDGTEWDGTGRDEMRLGCTRNRKDNVPRGVLCCHSLHNSE